MTDMQPQNYYVNLPFHAEDWHYTDADRVEFDDEGREWHR